MFVQMLPNYSQQTPAPPIVAQPVGSPDTGGQGGIPLPPPSTPPAPGHPRPAVNGPEMKSTALNNGTPTSPPPIPPPAPSTNPTPLGVATYPSGGVTRSQYPHVAPPPPSAPPTYNTQHRSIQAGSLVTQPVSAQHSVGSGLSAVHAGPTGRVKMTSLSPSRAPRGSAKIMIPSLAPPPSLLSSMSNLTHSTSNFMTTPNLMSSSLMGGSMDPIGMMNSHTLGSPLITSLPATVLVPTPPPAPPRDMQRMFNSFTASERKELFGIFVHNGFADDAQIGVSQKTCGGCGATARTRSKCPCGYSSKKRKGPRKLFVSTSDYSNDEGSDESESPKGTKRTKRSPKPNSKYMDSVPVKTRKPPMKSCPSCTAPCHTAKTQCSKCGHSFPRKPRKPKQSYPYYSPDSYHSFDDKDEKKKSDSRRREMQDMEDMPVELWSETETCSWLMEFEFGATYLSKFHENNVDGIMLLEMNEKLLRDELGVENEEHRSQMIISLNRLKKKRSKND